MKTLECIVTKEIVEKTNFIGLELGEDLCYAQLAIFESLVAKDYNKVLAKEMARTIYHQQIGCIFSNPSLVGNPSFEDDFLALDGKLGSMLTIPELPFHFKVNL